MSLDLCLKQLHVVTGRNHYSLSSSAAYTFALVLLQSVIFQSCKFQSCKFSYPTTTCGDIGIRWWMVRQSSMKMMSSVQQHEVAFKLTFAANGANAVDIITFPVNLSILQAAAIHGYAIFLFLYSFLYPTQYIEVKAVLSVQPPGYPAFSDWKWERKCFVSEASMFDPIFQSENLKQWYNVKSCKYVTSSIRPIVIILFLNISNDVFA